MSTRYRLVLMQHGYQPLTSLTTSSYCSPPGWASTALTRSSCWQLASDGHSRPNSAGSSQNERHPFPKELGSIHVRRGILDRKLGMSKEGWPRQKGFKLISKPHPRHTKESSQICYKNNHRDFSTSCTCALGTQWIQINHWAFSSNLRQLLLLSHISYVGLCATP